MKDLTLGPFDDIPPRSFETPRLRLRAITRADAELVFSYAGDRVATKYMAWKRAESPLDVIPFVEAVDQYFAGQLTAAGDFAYLIEEKKSTEWIGGCGIGIANDCTAGGGYILRPQYWGNGFAAEAWGPLIKWAKTQPRVMRIEATYHPDNPASGAVMRKVGLHFEQRRERAALYPNLGAHLGDEIVCAWIRA